MKFHPLLIASLSTTFSFFTPTRTTIQAFIPPFPTHTFPSSSSLYVVRQQKTKHSKSSSSSSPPRPFDNPLGHDYTTPSDHGPIASSLPIEQIHAALARRLRAKLDRNFTLADKIQKDLAEIHGVYIHDDKRLYRADGKGFGSFSSSYSDKKKKPSVLPAREANSNNSKRRSPYTFSSSTSSPPSNLDVETIKDLVAQRVDARLKKNYDKADSIQRLLKDEYNVYMDDKERVWGIGKTILVEEEEEEEADYNQEDETPRSRRRKREVLPYKQSKYSQKLSKEEEQTVTELVSERAMAKAQRNYSLADDIRHTLATNYDVALDDDAKLWSVGGKFPGRADRFLPYKQSLYSEPVDDEELKYLIQRAVEERALAKKKKDFTRADGLRDGLKTKYNVVIDDKLRQWSVGGKFESMEYKQRGGNGRFTTNDVEIIKSLVKKRTQAKQEYEYDIADEIKSELTKRYNVIVNDAKKEWRIDCEEYTFIPSSSSCNLSKEQEEEIQQKVQKRANAKKTRDYNTADEIRDELMGLYGVAIDDGNKEWRIVVEGDEDEDEFVMEAKRSQQSAFTQRHFKVQKNLEKEEEEEVSIFFEKEDETRDNEDDDDDDDDYADLAAFEEQDSDNIKVSLPSSSDTATTEADQEDFSSLTVPQLKEKLREVGLPVSGVKAKLVERLLDHYLFSESLV